MNIDKNKLLKMLVILAAICVIVGSITMLAGGNSMTLTEYARQNGISEQTSSHNTDAVETQVPNETQPSPNGGETQVTSDSEAASGSTVSESPGSSSESMLIGASLNGDSQLEERVTYTDSFYYEPLSDDLRRYITGVSYPSPSEDPDSDPPAVSYDDLCYLHILHYDFDGNPTAGEMICNKAIAQDLTEIFYELYRNEYRLEKVRLIDEYDGDDTASMEDNNTSCFNYRLVEGSASLSKHAWGLAVDINPLYNPYVTYGEDGAVNVSPAAGADYADRSLNFPYKIDQNDLCYRLFKQYGFTWGGDWNSSKDYQHFQKNP